MNPDFLLAAALGAGGLVALGLSIGAGMRLVPRLALAAHPPASGPVRSLTPWRSSLAFQWGSLLRQTNGTWVQGFQVRPETTAYLEDSLSEGRVDELAALLGREVPAGTIFSFRTDVGPDDGQLLLAHIEHCLQNRTYPLATLYHNFNNRFLYGMVRGGEFIRARHTLWVHLPETHPDDGAGSGSNLFLKESLKAGFSPAGMARLAQTCYRDRLVRRTRTAEREVLAKVDDTLRAIAEDFPVPLQRLSPEATFTELMRSHAPNTDSDPEALGFTRPVPLAPYVRAESLDFSEGWCVIHGKRTPVALISLTLPPQPGTRADTTRPLLRSRLDVRYTVVAEFVTTDTDTEKSRLDREIKSSDRWFRNSKGEKKRTPEQRRKEEALAAVRDNLGEPGRSLVHLRYFVLVHGEPFLNPEQKEQSLRKLDGDCHKVVKLLRKFRGAAASREEGSDLKEIYPRTLVGESLPVTQHRTGREIRERSEPLAALALLEDAWTGSKRPHSLLSTLNGRPFGLNLLKAEGTNAKFAYIVGGSGAGKSTLAATVCDGVLATYPDSEVWLCDFGSFKNYTTILNGLHFRFHQGDVLNLWEYDGLEQGIDPDKTHKRLVVQDICNLAGIPDTDAVMVGLVALLVDDVYTKVVPNNRYPGPKVRPRFTDFLNTAENYHLDPADEPYRRELLARLRQYRNHPVLDAHTSERFRTANARLRCFDFESLKTLEPAVANAMAFRIAATMIQLMNTTKEGVKTVKVLCFDEGQRLISEFPVVFNAINIAVRGGRKNNVVALFLTQAYTDLAPIRALVLNAGTRIIGLQDGEFPELTADCELSPAAVRAIKNIHNQEGLTAQYLILQGSGKKRQIEMVENILSPVHLWSFTTEPEETGAIMELERRRPAPLIETVIDLATEFPRGLAAAGLTLGDINWNRLLAKWQAAA